MTPDDVVKIRKAMNLTQAGLADRLGVARNTVARWEMGFHPVSAPAERLLKTLAVGKGRTKTVRGGPKSRRTLHG